MFWVDLAVAAPLDGIIAGALGYEMRSDDPNAQYIALVRWLKVVRLRACVVRVHVFVWNVCICMSVCMGTCACQVALVQDASNNGIVHVVVAC